jgi:hypothetical protein
MRLTLGATQLAMDVGVPVRGIHPAVVAALRGEGMARRGDGAVWRVGYWLFGGWWCGVLVLGQVRCSLRESKGALDASGSDSSWAAVGGFRLVLGRWGMVGVLGR